MFVLQIFFLESAGELRIKYIKKGKKEVQNGPITRNPPYRGQNLEYRKTHTHIAKDDYIESHTYAYRLPFKRGSKVVNYMHYNQKQQRGSSVGY